jgi:SAM-dependent methyltransferase
MPLYISKEDECVDLSRFLVAVTGIDMTKNFLEIAKKDAQCLGVKADYIHADMRELDYKQVFDRIYVLFTAIGYFEEVENTLVFQKIFESLKPGGIFCFDSHNRDTFMANYQPTVVVEREGNWILISSLLMGLQGVAIPSAQL